MSKTRKPKMRGVALLTFCLVILFNPNIKIIDIFPDFIAYFFILRMLGDAPEKVPYFEELKLSIKRLCLLSIIRIPAQMVTSFIKGINTQDGDINVLVTFVFAVAESYLLCMAITHLFNGIFYLGTRTDASHTIKPFRVSDRRMMDPEQLRVICYIFAVAKTAVTFIPETFLLSFDSMLASTDKHRAIRAAYPYTIIVAVLSVFIFGMVLLALCRRYAYAIRNGGGLKHAIESLVTPQLALEIEKKRKLRRSINSLTLMTVASCLTFEVSFTDLNNINLLPHFIFPILLIIGFSGLCSGYRKFIFLKITTVLSSATALAAYISSVNFFSDFSYIDLTSRKVAREAYTLYIVFSAVELVFLVIFLLAFAFAMKKYVLEKTLIPPGAPNYSRHDEEVHSSLVKKGFIFFGIGAFLGVMKFTDILLSYSIRYRHVSLGNKLSGTVFMNAAPWLGLVVTAAAATLAGFSFHYFGLIKDDIISKSDIE